MNNKCIFSPKNMYRLHFLLFKDSRRYLLASADIQAAHNKIATWNCQQPFHRLAYKDALESIIYQQRWVSPHIASRWHVIILAYLPVQVLGLEEGNDVYLQTDRMPI